MFSKLAMVKWRLHGQWCINFICGSILLVLDAAAGTLQLCGGHEASLVPRFYFLLKLAGTKNRAWYPLSRSWCACASHSPESGDSCTVVIWFVILSVK